MKERYLKKLTLHLIFKYTCVIFALSLGGVILLYVFDNVLNGMVIDFLKVLAIDGNPFEVFRNLFAIVLPLTITMTGFILCYFLCRELISYVHILMEGVDDVLEKKRLQVNFPSDMQDSKELLLSIALDYKRHEEALHQDSEKKKDLVYLLSQDIKMPLQNILMYLELLEKEERISKELKKEFMADVLYKAMDLEEMINEFFNITRFNLEYTKCDYDKMYLDLLIEQVIEEEYYDIMEKELHLKTQFPHHLLCYGDNEKIARCMRDLLRNLIALATAQSIIEIEIVKKEGCYIIRLKGNVKHLNDDQLAHLFHNYYRLDMGDDKQHVLGLSVAKQIVQMHEGSIQATSMKDQFCFQVMLPDHQVHNKK